MYEKLTDFIPILKDDEFGDWVIDHENDGTIQHPIQMPFVTYGQAVRGLEAAIYDFMDTNHPFKNGDYGKILEENGMEWGVESMSAKDVSSADANCIIAMLIGAVRAERFCDGALLDFLKRGCIQRWLGRLKEMDESQ